MKCGLIRYLSNDVSELMDVGDTRAKLFAKLGIRKFKDLLFHLPTDYIDRRYSPNIYEIKNGDLVTLEVEVFEINIKTSFRHKSPSKILCKNESGFIELIFEIPHLTIQFRFIILSIYSSALHIRYFLYLLA